MPDRCRCRLRHSIRGVLHVSLVRTLAVSGIPLKLIRLRASKLEE